MPDTLTEPFRLDVQIGHLLRQAYRTASAHLAQRLAAHNLKPQQFATLARLRDAGIPLFTEGAAGFYRESSRSAP